MMKKKRLGSIVLMIAVAVAVIAGWILASGYFTVKNAGYTMETMEDVLEGKTYLQSREYQQTAAQSMQGVLEAAARSSRLEKDGAYDPDRIIRIQDYVEDGTIYDDMPESEKGNGLCYRLGDLYQWSLKGAIVSNKVLNEAYKPLFFGSIQEYANQYDEEYNVLVKQIEDSLEKLQQDVTAYQQDQKNWAMESTNVRYALYDMGNGQIYTNAGTLRGVDAPQDQLADFFTSCDTYYIYDSRTGEIREANVGGMFTNMNVNSLLDQDEAHLSGEYQFYVAIDTTFPVTDSLSAGAVNYTEAQMTLQPLVKPMIFAGAALLFLLILVIVRIIMSVMSLADVMMESAPMAIRIIVFFLAYELIQVVLHKIFGDSRSIEILIIVGKAAVLAALLWESLQRQKLLDGVRAIADGNGETTIDTEHLTRGNRQMAEAINDLGEGLKNALQEQVKSEQMKADLITNVSHDLKTPLTSIINYVYLMKREQIDNPKVHEYLEVLDQKSQRLKQLTNDLVEASRASSGNVALNMEKLDLREFLMQTSGEFEEKFAARGLHLMTNCPPHPLFIMADGRRLWRIIENLYRNVEKYAMPNTRVYLNVVTDGSSVAVSMKNISEQPLNISAEELTERFTRGDESRTTEGSGLGLSIAKDLTELQGGKFEIYLDGDLFKVTITFPCVTETEA